MSKLFRFGSFTVDVTDERVWDGKQEVSLRRKPFAILKHLLANPFEELERMFEARTTTFPMGAPGVAAPLVEIYRRAGKRDRALALVDKMLGFVRDRGERFLGSEYHRLRGELIEEVDPAGAAASYEASVVAARAIEAPIWEGRARERLEALRSR